MNVVRDAIENAASAGNDAQTPLIRAPGFSTVSAKRVGTAREIVRRFLQDVPGEMTAFELLEQIEDDR